MKIQTISVVLMSLVLALAFMSLATAQQSKCVRTMASGQLSVAVAAIKEKGILSGQRIEHRSVGAPRRV